MSDSENSTTPWGRKLATAFFLAVLLGVPLTELGSGVWPGVGTGDGWTLHDVVRGKWGSAVERELGERSVVAERARPAYNAAMLRAFREVNPKVVLGQDDWLFLASTVRNYPPPGAPRLLDETTDLIRRLDEWFAGQGTELYLLVVPNKASVHPERLPRLRPPFEPHYDAVFTALSEKGVWTDDLLSELRPTGGELAYHAYDTHWLPVSARKAVEKAADSVQRRFEGREGGLPGRVVEARIVTEPEIAFVGGTVEMLGVGDWFGIREGMSEVSARIQGVDAISGERLGSHQTEDIVWVGTSFSEGYRTASMLSALLERAVEDRSFHGLGPTKGLLEVVDELRRGQRPAPALVVWEFPERYFFTSPAQMQEPLRQVLQGIAYDPTSAVPLPVRERRVEGLELDIDQPGQLAGTASANPRLYYELEAPIEADGSRAVAVTITASRFALVRVFLDTGEGTSAQPQFQSTIPKRGVAQRVVAPLEGSAPVRAIVVEIVTQRRQRPGQSVEIRVDGPELWTR